METFFSRAVVILQLKSGDSPSLQVLKEAIPKWYTVCDQLNNKISNYQKETSEKVSNMGKRMCTARTSDV